MSFELRSQSYEENSKGLLNGQIFPSTFATLSGALRLLAEDKQIALKCATQARVEVEGDPARLKQVVVNLVDNAIKYTTEGGEVDITVQALNGNAVLEVSDTGIGIPREALPHVFERFYRVDRARSRKMGGAGLGLSIVKSICAAHGGDIHVESSDGKGSRFRVDLPLAKGLGKDGQSKPHSASGR